MPQISAFILRFALLAALVLLMAGCKMPLYSGLPEKDANEMLALLLEHGLDAAKEPGEKGTWNLTVEKADLVAGMELLKARAMPRVKYGSLGQVFRKEGIISTPLEERARFMYALSQELGGTIAAIDGVLDARVHIVLPEQDSLGEKLSPSSSAVFIRHRADVDMQGQVHQIKKLMENSVRGLKYEVISVFLFPAQAEQPSGAHARPRQGMGPEFLTAAALAGVFAAATAVLAVLFWRRRKAS